MEGNGKDVIKAILLHPRRARLVEEEILLLRQNFDADIIHAMLSEQFDLNITLDMLSGIYMNEKGKGTCELLSPLLDQSTSDLPITERVLVAAARYLWKGCTFALAPSTTVSNSSHGRNYTRCVGKPVSQ